MIETICKNCGARYQPGTDHACSKPPAKKVPRNGGEAKVVRGSPPETDEPTDGIKVAAGGKKMQPVPSTTLKQAEAAAAHLAPKKRGRPKGKTDRNAYQRELMRKRRAEGK